MVYLPLILGERTRRRRRKTIIIWKRVSGYRIEGDVGLGERVVVDQVDDARVGKDRLAVPSGELRQILSVPSLVSELEGVAAADKGHDVPPVEGMLDVILVRIRVAPAYPEIRNVHHRNGE